MATKSAYGHGSGGGFVPAQEVFQLMRLLRENRGRMPGEISYIVAYHGEASQKSFREWTVKNILLWQRESKSDPYAYIEIESVSRSSSSDLVYHVDLSISSRGNAGYFALRIYQVSPESFILTIQRKPSRLSIPVGLNAAPIVWSKAGKIGGFNTFTAP